MSSPWKILGNFWVLGQKKIINFKNYMIPLLQNDARNPSLIRYQFFFHFSNSFKHWISTKYVNNWKKIFVNELFGVRRGEEFCRMKFLMRQIMNNGRRVEFPKGKILFCGLSHLLNFENFWIPSSMHEQKKFHKFRKF